MKVFNGMLAVAILAITPLAALAQNQQATADVRKFFQNLDVVMGQHDGAAFEKLLTDDFAFIAINGVISERKEVLELQKAGQLVAGTANEILSVRVHGDSAIVTYKTKAPLNGGTTIIGTRVFVKQGGAWKWALSQGSVVSGPLPGR